MKEAIFKILDHYEKFYPHYTRGSLIYTIKLLIDKNGTIDALTLDHYLKEINYGGLGYGVLKRIEW